METLKGEICYLRALEPDDLNLLYQLENDEAIWEISNTLTPYSKYLLQQYLENSHRDIYEVKQLRLVICDQDNDTAVGFVDLFDYDPKHLRVGIGIVIFHVDARQKGFGSEALQLIEKYTSTHLKVHQLYANITKDNEKSVALFEKAGYNCTGVKRDWVHSASGFKDELLYQRILDNRKLKEL